MVKSKEELVQCANAWVNQAKGDVRNQIVNFLQMSNMSVENLASILAITPRELSDIIETNNDVSLTTFAKLLIATDNVLEVKPAAESPLANQPMGAQTPRQQPQTAPTTQPRDSHGRFVSHRTNNTPQRPQNANHGMPMSNDGRGICIDREGYPVDPRNGRRIPNMPRVPMGANGQPLPPTGYPMPNGNGMSGMPIPPQPMNAPRFGGMPGMAQRMHRENPQPMPQPQVVEEAPTVGGTQPLDELASHSRAELVQMISDNFWNGEIDVEESTKTDLINFIMSKRQQPQPTVVEQTAANTQNDASVEAFQSMLDEAVRNNPNLADVIAQYRPQR